MNYQFHDLRPALADFKTEVLAGLSATPKQIAPKFFYDERGSELFEAITETREYYPTRTEIQIIESACQELTGVLGAHGLLIELGSGSTRKIRNLLSCLQPQIYMPIDISGDHLQKQSAALAKDFPQIQIHAVCADYTQGLQLPEIDLQLSRAAFYPGSSIGNFEPKQAVMILRHLATQLGTGGTLLIGVDLQKDVAVLNAAYNDAQGITAAFNQNLLQRINSELQGNFDLNRFAHRAAYNAVLGRMEMHLVSQGDQRVRVAGVGFHFADGESIHTENSYKYTLAGFAELAEQSGFRVAQVWTDANHYFSVQALIVC